MAEIESILHFMGELLKPEDLPDYPQALNGLQVEGPRAVEKIGAAVDASEASIRLAVETGVDLLLVHHGLFWGGLGPLTGARFRKVERLIRGGVALYSMHLPLDAHPEIGNCALLLRALGLEPKARFGAYKGVEMGWWGESSLAREELLGRVRSAVGGEVRLISGGPDRVERVGVLTGAGAGALSEAERLGLDALVTGEAPHHAYHEAMELGLNLYLAGHYATETFGVRALAERVAERFQLRCSFLDLPTGM